MGCCIERDDKWNGDNDDLKPLFIDAINTTDIDISFYEKSEEYIDSYVRDKDMMIL